MIYLLHESPTENARMLDDATLSEMIGEIAQVLCNVHHLVYAMPLSEFAKGKRNDHIPLPAYKFDDEYTKYASQCAANYEYMCELGHTCCQEWHWRFSDKCKADMDSYDEQYECGAHHEMKAVIAWCMENRPDLHIPCKTPNYPGYPKPFPINLNGAVVTCCRNYYRTVLPKDANWTRREKPEWI